MTGVKLVLATVKLCGKKSSLRSYQIQNSILASKTPPPPDIHNTQKRQDNFTPCGLLRDDPHIFQALQACFVTSLRVSSTHLNK